MNNYPKLHNAGWPGVVGKGPDAEEPFIDLDTMLDWTAAAEVDGVRFDGVDLFLSAPHVDIDSTDDDLKRLAEKVQSLGLVIGSVVAPVWPPTGGGSAMGDEAERGRFLSMVEKACAIARRLRELGVRPYGVVRIDSSVDPGTWAADPEETPGASPRPSGKRAPGPGTRVSSWRPRERSAGVGCIVGRRC